MNGELEPGSWVDAELGSVVSKERMLLLCSRAKFANCVIVEVSQPITRLAITGLKTITLTEETTRKLTLSNSGLMDWSV